MLTLYGCGGRKVVTTKPVEIAIPPDLAKAFEVKEFAQPVEDTKAKTKKKKKEKAPKAAKKTSKKGAEEALSGPSEAAFVIPNRRPNPDPLWVGEKILMDVSWLSTKAGEFSLEVLPFKELDGRKVYHIKGSAKTSDLFSLIYRAEDWVETFVDYEGWFPYKFILHGDETKHLRNNLELFDHGAKRQYVHAHDVRLQQNNEVHEQKGFKDLTPFSQDSLSALYYVRTQKLDDGAVIKFPMTTNGSQWETNVTIIAHEEVDTKMGYMKAIKTKVETRFNGVMQQQGDAFIWFSDDERKYPLRFEAKVRIGWVAGIAKKIEPGVSAEPRASGMPEANPENKDLKKDGTNNSPEKGSRFSAIRKTRRWFKLLLEHDDETK